MADKKAEVDATIVRYTAELIRLRVKDKTVNAKLRRARTALQQNDVDDAAKLVGEIGQVIEEARRRRA